MLKGTSFKCYSICFVIALFWYFGILVLADLLICFLKGTVQNTVGYFRNREILAV